MKTVNFIEAIKAAKQGKRIKRPYSEQWMSWAIDINGLRNWRSDDFSNLFLFSYDK